MARKIPAIITATTEDLNKVLETRIGKLDFGRLRLAKRFPFFSDESGYYSWKVAYEFVGASTSEIDLGYKLDSGEKDVWGSIPISSLPGFSRIYESREEAIVDFERKVLEIPERRKEKIKRYAKELIEGKFMGEKGRLEDFYSPEELEFIRSLR